MDKLKKIFKIISYVIFPLIMLYCIGRALFTRDIYCFFGGISLAVIGIVLGAWLVNPNIFTEILQAIHIL